MKIINKIKELFQDKQDTKDSMYTEISTFKSPLYPDSYFEPFNSDKLYRKKGNYSIYKEMMDDDQVKAIVKMKQNAILSKGIDIFPASNNNLDIEIYNFIKYILEDYIKGSIDEKMIDILSAMIYGFSITEIIYKIIEKGKFKNKIGIYNLKTRPPDTFEIYTDGKSNITEIKQYQPNGLISLPLEKLFTYSWDSDFGNVYGNSDLRAAYRAYWSKNVIIKFRNMYAERFGQPKIIGKYPVGATDKDKTQLLNIIKTFQAQTCLRLPIDFMIELLEAKTNAYELFEKSINQDNIMIARSMLLPDLMGFSGQNQGSYALGSKQFDIFIIIWNRIRNSFAEMIKENIIKNIVDKNYITDVYPIIKFKDLSDENYINIFTNFILAREKGVIQSDIEDENYIREKLGFKKRENNNNDNDNDNDDKKEKTNNKIIESIQKVKSVNNNFTEGKRELTKYEKKINFTEIKNNLNELENKYALEFSNIITKTKDELINSIIRRNILESKDFKEIEKIDLKYVGDLRLMFQDMFRKLFNEGKKDAKNEIKIKKEFVDRIIPLTPREALEYFNRKAFTLAGTEKEEILKNVKNYIYQAIKSGKTNKDLLYDLEKYFEKYTVIQKVTRPDVKAEIQEIQGRIETVIRTNENDAYNQGRMSIYNDENVKDIIPYLQYSSILDDRTTELCEYLDGKIYKADNPIWAKITPPNGYNCRSTVIPITIYEIDGKIEEDKLPSKMPDRKFGG